MNCDDVDLIACIDGRASEGESRHVEDCDRCLEERAALERQIELLLPFFRETDALDSPPRPLPAELVRKLAREYSGSSDSAGGRIIGGADRFKRDSTDWSSLPAAAQPDDLTDAGDESESRRRDEKEKDDEDGKDDEPEG